MVVVGSLYLVIVIINSVKSGGLSADEMELHCITWFSFCNEGLISIPLEKESGPKCPTP
jgi:hypothetical protein